MISADRSRRLFVRCPNDYASVMPRLRVVAAGLALVAACASESPEPQSGHVDQANKYFDTLDISADPDNVPSYSILVARWELPPWL